MAASRIAANMQRAAESRATPFTRAANEYIAQRPDGAWFGVGGRTEEYLGQLKHPILAGKLHNDPDLAACVALANEAELAVFNGDPQVREALADYTRQRQVSRLSVDRKVAKNA